MYKKSAKDLEKELDTNIEKGISKKVADERLASYGYNELLAKKRKGLFLKFLSQFNDILIIILIIAAVVSIIIDPKEWIESVIIFAVITINAILGVVQESNAEKSLEALVKMSSPLCKVIRNGNVEQMMSRLLVPGDVILIEAGDYVPADARIVECSNLFADESALTGEGFPVLKSSDDILNDVSIGDRVNMLFSSTFITKGRGVAIVTSTGMNTEIGKIANMLSDTSSRKTPLQIKLDSVAKVIGIICIFVCVLVFGLEYLQNSDALESFKTAIALAVAAIPEGLSSVVTIVLAIGVSVMSKKNAIVKKLPAVETLGSTSVVCSDKTGTLTQNKMTVVEVYRNEVRSLSQLNDDDKELISYFALCSDAKITIVDGKEQRIGDPTETALIELNNKYGSDISNIRRLADIPFDSERKMMSVICKVNDKIIMITKGAPDNIISNSKHNERLEYALNVNNNMAVRALRVLGVAVKELPSLPEIIDESLETDLEFIGLVGMIDPSRPEVKEAIKLSEKAGIRTIMITGDHKTTASAIAKELGILKEGYKAISSDELAALDDEYLDSHIEEYAVYARVAPEDKVRIVNSWQKLGKVVAMTGDGVNDAPALKKADIGCAMGITGTDVAKEAADMILVDDNFTTIITAVKQGRSIYDNVKKCVKYLLSSNIGEVLTIFVASLISYIFGLSLGVPLSPIHLLWINLITDSLPAFGLGIEKPSDGIMDKKPRDSKEGFFSNHLAFHIVLEGAFIGALTLTSYIIGYKLGSHITGQTMAFFTLSCCQLFHAYNVKSDESIISKNTFNNKLLNFAFVIGLLLQLGVMYIPVVHDKVFGLESLSFDKILIAFGLAFSLVLVMEIYKFIKKQIKRS